MKNYREYIIEDTSNNKVVIITDIHNCHIDWHEMPTYDRMNLMCNVLNEEYNKYPFDVLLSLGDYSLDFWKWNIGGSYLWDEPVSKTEDFINRFCNKLPLKLFMIPGNHEQYSSEDWERITGYPREYVLVYGNYIFVMLDTFGGGLSPEENHDGVYTGINTELVSEVLETYPDKKIILCAHVIIPSKESDEVKKIICNNSRILCAFTGHTHCDNTVILPDDWRNMPVFYCGNFSYNSWRNQEKTWGYRVVDFSDGRFSTEYVRI